MRTNRSYESERLLWIWRANPVFVEAGWSLDAFMARPTTAIRTVIFYREPQQTDFRPLLSEQSLVALRAQAEMDAVPGARLDGQGYQQPHKYARNKRNLWRYA